MRAIAQPANDNCASAEAITITNGGWDFGSFTSNTHSLNGATIQAGEYVHPAQVARDRSMWFKFSLPTTRNVRIILRQPGPPFAMNANDAGWTLFRTNSCLPGAVDVVDPPILNIEGYTHECLKQGDYLLQVTGAFTSTGPVYAELQISPSTANEIEYDYAAGPYDFGIVSGITLNPASLNHFYDIGCQSIYQGEAQCPNATYTQSTWHTFTTDASVDYVRFEMREDPWIASNLMPRNWGYVLYEGDCRNDSTPDNGPGLTTVDACRQLSVINNNQFAALWYPCELQPNTTYTIKLTSSTAYTGRINVRMFEVGAGPTVSPSPITIPPPLQFGTLAYNSNYYINDRFSCNGLMLNNLCGSLVPDTVTRNGVDYDLNAGWSTFTLTSPANVDFQLTQGTWCQPSPLIRVFRGDAMSAGCAIPMDTMFLNSLYYRCMPAGTYSVQVLGQMRPPVASTCQSNLGKNFQLRIRLDQVAPMQFGLFTPQDIDTINNGAVLASGVQYLSTQDYVDCRTTVLPDGNVCGTNNDRAIYRLIHVGQDGILTVGGGVWWHFNYRLYRGDASSAPIVGGRIQGLVDQAGCQNLYYPFKVCVTPGWYTLVTFGDVSDINTGDRPWVRFDAFPPTLFTDPLLPNVMDTLGNANMSITGIPTRFNCTDNPLTILGYAPCNNATKQVYREFYLDSPQLVTFTSNYTQFFSGGSVSFRIFNGRLSQNTLTGLYRNCGTNWTECMQPGWYTIVAYGSGEEFLNPTYTTGLGGSIGDLTNVTLTVNPNLQKYGTFATAEAVNGGGPIFWQADVPGGHTSQHPKNFRSYTLGTEYWECANNLPFPAGVTPCTPSHNRVSYRVFTLSKPSHVYIDGLNPWPYGHQSRLYSGDITTTSPPYAVVQQCISDQMRLCLNPGTYTLVSFAGDAHIGRTMTPVIYLDSLGTSKFDFAANAYDFGNIPNTALEYRGNLIHPPGPFGRAPSNDFIFCTTTSSATDPDNVCPNGTPPPGPALPNPWDPRQDLWYTFTVTGPGQVDVSVYNQTPGKPTRSPFAVYKAPSTAFPPADSTLAQGLQFVTTSTTYYCGNYQTVNFYRDPCNALTTDRYYVVVDRNTYSNSSYYEPNIQLEVGVKFTPAPPAFVLYDHYSQANLITGNPTSTCTAPYTPNILNSGTYTGCVGNLNCATRDASDQNSCGTHTIWYAFDVGSTGQIRINYTRPGAGNVTQFNPSDIMLFRSVVAGDSTNGGLVPVPLSTVNLANPDFNAPTVYPWGQACMQPGRYYLMFTGCNFPTETVIPRIWLTPQEGDLCTDPIEMNIGSAGVYQNSLIVNCLTIGEAPGEDGSNMGCLGGPVGIKTAWFEINLTDTTSLYDLDVRIDEFTNVTGDRIKYRIGYGDCNAMTFDNCVADGVFIILNLKCRSAGSFWVQVALPENATDSIRLNITATAVSDTSCQPIDPTRPRASFDYIANCADEPVVFTNNSTTGPGVTYTWNFDDGFGSTLTHPVHQFAVPDTYYVSLIVDNGFGADTMVRPVIVYPRPGSYFTASPGTPYFVSTAIQFTDASTGALPSASYYWNFCAGPPPCGASLSNFSGQTPPPVTYSTPGWKTVCLTVINGNCDSTFCYNLFISDTTIFAGGPYDGHGVIAMSSNCVQTEQNVYAGGPYDGHDAETLLANCAVQTVNLYAGGPYDGSTVGTLSANCGVSLDNIYAGGPYDGSDVEALLWACPQVTLNIYAGGPYDGHDAISIQSPCSNVNLNIFAGGPYDGFDLMAMYCDTIPILPPPPPPCSTCFWAGGPYDGSGSAGIAGNCAPQPNIYSGGPYDGHDTEEIRANCPQAIVAIYSGGPYDGHAHDGLWAPCGLNQELIFAGGPYDGHDPEVLSSACPVVSLNIYAGGPYDGHDPEQRVPNGTGMFTVVGDTVCVGYAGTMTASAPTNWFVFSGGQYQFVGGTSATFTTPVFYSPGIYTWWVDNPFSCQKLLVQTIVLDTLANPSFVYNLNCPGDSSFFTNQTIIPGPSLPTIGAAGAGAAITSAGTTGIPPGITQISFSSQQYLNFNLLANNIHDQQNAWTSNSTGPSTQWVQWAYLTPRSVNRFYYWPRNNCCPDKGPTQLRLYYDDGGGWVLAKTWNPTYPSNANFDTGIFFETANIYAQRWKLEVDVLVANAPSWGEFQVFASLPMVGGDVLWDFGDGSYSTMQDPAHVYGTSGNYLVNLTVNVPAILCINNVIQPITVPNCGILPLTRNELQGIHISDKGRNQLTWKVEGSFDVAELLKLEGNTWIPVHNWISNGGSTYQFFDPNIVYGATKVYQVRSWDVAGNEQFSNRVSIFVARPLEFEVTLYPNPVEDHQANFLLKLPKDALVEVEIHDLFGHQLMAIPDLHYVAGVHRLNLNIGRLPQATYLATIIINGKAYTKRMTVLGL